MQLGSVGQWEADALFGLNTGRAPDEGQAEGCAGHEDDDETGTDVSSVGVEVWSRPRGERRRHACPCSCSHL